MSASTIVALVLSLVIAACSPAASTAPAHPVASSTEAQDLDRVTAVHGGHGPWVVAGYRMGQFALKRLGLERGSFDLEIIHYTPREVQYSCVADGAAAATGASLGKLNLSLADAPPSDLHTVYRNRATHQTVTLRLTKAFHSRFLNVPREHLGDVGRQVMTLRDEEIFEVVR